MVESSEQTMELNLSLLNTLQDNQVEKYFNLQNNFITVNQMAPYDNVALQVASSYGCNEVIQLILTNSALKSLENISSPLVPYDEPKMNEIKQLFLENFDFHDSQDEIPDNDYIEWSLSGDNLIKKAKEFRAQIDLYKTYDNQHHLISKLLIEIIEYYLNEYLVQQEHFSKDETKNIENCFIQAIEEQNYLKYFIKAYTLTNNFRHVLNKHLALYILCYFDPPSYSSLQKKYRLFNCLAHIVTLLINHPDIHKYKYNGITYRGLLMKESDLKCYSIGMYILNRSFVSTSKKRSIAQLFADNGQENISRETSDNHDLKRIPVLFRYTIKQNQTGIDIEHISMIPDEEEVLILPFSVFKIKDRIESCPNMCSSVLVEIDLEECEDDAQINLKQKSQSLTSLGHQTKNRKNIVGSTCLYISIALCIMFSLIVAAGFTVKAIIEINANPPNETNAQKLDTIWKQVGITIAGGNGIGTQLNQLNRPFGIFIDDDLTIYIADWRNHRIVEWKSNTTNGRIVAGGDEEGNETNQLSYPTDVIIDKENNSLIISDFGNRRVMRWSRQNNTNGQIIIEDIDCFGLTMDKNGSLYVSDSQKDEVKRWKRGEKNGTIVAGGHGKGNHSYQLNFPTFIFVDNDHSLYVSDQNNHRVMKWLKNSKEGIVVAGGNGLGNSSAQLCYPQGIIDQFDQIYVADFCNNRVMRWRKEDKEGTVVVGENGYGQQLNQLKSAMGLSFDRHRNLYVADVSNHRIQKFEIAQIENDLFG